MSPRVVLKPGPGHRITVEPSTARVVVSRGGTVLADSTAALVLREASYPPVYYLPRADADLAHFTRTEHSTYCPYKGDASYFSIEAGAGPAENAVWSYEAPYAAVAPIKDHLAFYPDQVEIRELPAA